MFQLLVNLCLSHHFLSPILTTCNIECRSVQSWAHNFSFGLRLVGTHCPPLLQVSGVQQRLLGS